MNKKLHDLFERVLTDDTVDPLVTRELSKAAHAKTVSERASHIETFDKAMPNTPIHQGYAAEALEAIFITR